MKKIEYPKYVYSKDKSVIVNNKEDHKKLGSGWYESPADFKKVIKKEVKKEAKKEVKKDK